MENVPEGTEKTTTCGSSKVSTPPLGAPGVAVMKKPVAVGPATKRVAVTWTRPSTSELLMFEFWFIDWRAMTLGPSANASNDGCTVLAWGGTPESP